MKPTLLIIAVTSIPIIIGLLVWHVAGFAQGLIAMIAMCFALAYAVRE